MSKRPCGKSFSRRQSMALWAERSSGLEVFAKVVLIDERDMWCGWRWRRRCGGCGFGEVQVIAWRGEGGGGGGGTRCLFKRFVYNRARLSLARRWHSNAEPQCQAERQAFPCLLFRFPLSAFPRPEAAATNATSAASARTLTATAASSSTTTTTASLHLSTPSPCELSLLFSFMLDLWHSMLS